jgi:trehalose utilization protein
MEKRINVTVWNETDKPTKAYENGIHNAVADFLTESGLFSAVRTATQNQDEHGLPGDVLDSTDVLLWWGHQYHHLVRDDIVEKVRKRVLDGMGFIALHSAHASKVFKSLMGTDSNLLRWRDVGERERVWTVAHNHPITNGVPECFVVPQSEMYGECFHVPTPDELIFISWYQGGEVFRSGCVFNRGFGKVFYFSPGHEEYPIYKQPEIQKVLINGILWAAPAEYKKVAVDHTPESPESAFK